MNHYNILVLGPRGSGKTVFIPSMYYQLSQPQIGTNFFLETVDYYQGRLLTKAYSILSEEWPEPTVFGKTTEWKFNCNIKTRSGKYTAFSLSYHDYAGGRLTDGVNDENEFREIIEKADALVGLIDGYKLLKVMKQEGYKDSFFSVDLKNIIVEINAVHKQNKPVHLIISKWDLLKEFSLSQIREKLLGWNEFKKFVQAVVQYDDFVRLIPVSSVGFDFARLGENGEMEIRPEGQLAPYNVEIPIALSLLDPMRFALEDKKRELEKEKENASNVKVDPNLNWWEELQRWAGIAIEDVSKVFNINSAILTELSEYWKKTGDDKIKYARERENELKVQLFQELDKVNDQQTALNYIVLAFSSIEIKLDSQYPGSQITKEL